MAQTATREGGLRSVAKIWILEDDPDIGYILNLFLGDEGFETSVITSANAFRAAVADDLPDLFLMDVMLPDGDGIALCIELKNQQRSKSIPVLMMSAHAGLEQVKTCKPDGFIAKP